MYQLSRLPPGVLYVCDAKPHMERCYTCREEDRCSWSAWDAYEVKPGVALNGLPRADGGTISGLAAELNRIVVQYLGRFCTSTHERFINTGDLKNFCNYCDEWGHMFDLEECGIRVEGYVEAQHVAERDAREAERRAWSRTHRRGNPLEDAEIY